MRYILLIVLFMISIACYATIYMQVNNGNTLYSDTPQKNSVAIQVTPTNVTQSKPQPDNNSTETKKPIEPEEKKPYVTFQITYPGQDETIQNQPVIPFTFKIDPELQPGDKIQLFLDGKPYGDPEPSDHLEMGQLDRGTHNVSAEIIDENLTVVKTSNVNTIYVHQQHLGGASAPGPSGPSATQ